MSFSNIHLPSLTNDLHLEFGNQTVNAVEKSDLESLNNSAPFKDYRAGVQSEDLVSKKIIKSRFTGEIQAWDGSRDGIIWGIYGIVRANRYHWEEKISAAANNLMIPIGSYGDISSLPLLAQMPILMGVFFALRDFNKPIGVAEYQTIFPEKEIKLLIDRELNL